MISSRKGQTILEVVIATTLISISIIAALSLINRSQKTNNYSKQLEQATSFNNQVADYLRNQRDEVGWQNLVEKITADNQGGIATYCFDTLPAEPSTFLDVTSGACGDTTYITDTIFIRTATFNTSSLASGLIPITITTSWQDTSLHTNTLNLELTKWN